MQPSMAPTTSLNLDSVRARAQELRGSLVEVVATLTHAPQQLQWDGVLKKFATINIQLMALREQLRGMMRQVVVHPKLVTDPLLAQALPLQLASADLPEMQSKDAELQAGEEERLARSGIPPEGVFEAADAQIDEFNRLLADITTDQDALLAVKSPARLEMAQCTRRIARASAANREAAEAARRPGAAKGAAAAGAAAGAGRAGGPGAPPPKKPRMDAGAAVVGGGAGAKGAGAGGGMDRLLVMMLTGEGARPPPPEVKLTPEQLRAQQENAIREERERVDKEFQAVQVRALQERKAATAMAKGQR